MNSLLDEIRKIPASYFTLSDVRKVSRHTEKSVRVEMSRLASSGDIVRLEKGVYCKDVAQVDWEEYACRRYAPSYISFEYALAIHNVLSQKPVQSTLATKNRTRRVLVADRELVYRHIQPKMYWGYARSGRSYIADPEKAFLDLLYMSVRGYANFDSEEMNLGILNKKKIREYTAKIDIVKMTEVVRSLGF